MKKTKNTETCFISKKEFNIEDLVRGSDLRPGLYSMIKKDYPDFDEDSFINNIELAKFRTKYLEKR